MQIETAPGPKGHFLLGNFKEFRTDLLKFLENNMNQYGDIFRFRVGPQGFTCVYHPDHVKEVVLEKVDTFKKGKAHDLFRPFLGNGLVTADGDLWKRHRRMIQPIFNKPNIEKLSSVMVDCAVKTRERWKSKEGQVVDLYTEMMRLTLEIVALSLFGSNIKKEDLEEIIRCDKIVAELILEKYFSVVPIPYSFPTPLNNRLRRAIANLDKIVYRLVLDRKKSPSSSGKWDLLDLLLNAKDPETGKTLTDEEVRDQAVTFLFAGHETTANTLVWTYLLLHRNPAFQDKMAAEVQNVVGNREATAADFEKLTTTRAILDESMRYYPSAWTLVRAAGVETTVGGFKIPKGDIVMVAPYLTHKLKKFWKNPEKFSPERFLNKDLPEHRQAFIPFLAGPRMCIGNHFALMEAILVLATLAKEYRVEFVDDAGVVPLPLLTMQPSNAKARIIGI